MMGCPSLGCAVVTRAVGVLLTRCGSAQAVALIQNDYDSWGGELLLAKLLIADLRPSFGILPTPLQSEMAHEWRTTHDTSENYGP